MYIKYQIDTWVLNYSYLRQLQLLDKAEKNPWFVAKFVFGIVLVILFSYILIARLRRQSCKDKLLCEINPLIEKLKKSNFKREEQETMHQFLQRYISLNPNNKEIIEIDRIYEEIRYAENKSPKLFKDFKLNVDKFVLKK
jgi:hypothetical protein